MRAVMPSLESINNLKSKEKEICELYASGESSNKIAAKLQLSKSSVKKTLKNHGVIIRDASFSHQIYGVNENIFENIDSHEKAYWVGFLTADGTITGGRLKLALAVKDIKHLYAFKKFMGSTHPILTYKQLQGKTSAVKNKEKDYYYAIIGFSNKKLIQDLSKYSITKRKSFTVKFGQNIPHKYMCSYMAGLVDGDGFITVSNDNIHFGFVSHEKFAQDFQNYLMKVCDLQENKLADHENVKSVRYGGKQVKRILEFLYSDTPVFLERKKSKLDFFQ